MTDFSLQYEAERDAAQMALDYGWSNHNPSRTPVRPAVKTMSEHTTLPAPTGTVEQALQPLRVLVSRLEDDVPYAEIANGLGLIDDVIRGLRELKANVEAHAVEMLRKIGPQIIGTKKHYAGPTKKHKCRDVRKTVDFLMGLDLTALGDCLSSAAVKPGEFKKTVTALNKPELFEEYFETTEEWDLKEGKGGKAERAPQLQIVDERFLPQKPSAAAPAEDPDKIPF